MLLSSWDGPLSVQAILTEGNPEFIFSKILVRKLGGRRGVGPSQPRLLPRWEASESLEGWHANGVWSTTESTALFLPHRTSFSLNLLRWEDKMWLRFPGIIMVPRWNSGRMRPVSPVSRCNVPAPRAAVGVERKRGSTYVFLQNASGSLVLRSGLVVYAKLES